MKTAIWVLWISILLLALVGCKRTPPTDYVVLPDTSQSIERDGILNEFKTIDGLVDQMHRGDSLTIIPITGNAMSETPGHILRFTAPTDRQPYDHDLVIFREQAHKIIRCMENAALASPSKHTDILGALDIARQGFESSPTRNSKTLIVMSDFIEDDGTYRFTSDRVLVDAIKAQRLALCLQKEHAFVLRSTQVLLYALQSKDLRSISSQRQCAVREFWKRYFAPTVNAELQAQ